VASGTNCWKLSEIPSAITPTTLTLTTTISCFGPVPAGLIVNIWQDGNVPGAAGVIGGQPGAPFPDGGGHTLVSTCAFGGTPVAVCTLVPTNVALDKEFVIGGATAPPGTQVYGEESTGPP
jgi:hypothetical protein